jgi:hypothetical protein
MRLAFFPERRFAKILKGAKLCPRQKMGGLGMRAVIRDAVDVVVVGVGLGGAAFSKRLSERVSGLRVVCLERGGWLDRAET